MTMNQPVNTMAHMTAAVLSGLMGLGEELPPIGWLVIQEEAAGVSRGEIARALGCEVGDIQGLIESITGEKGDEAEGIWKQGIIALRTARLLTSQSVERGWDDMEAMAVEKLNQSLVAMRGAGDPDVLLRIASAANKAIRRGRGESGQGERKGMSMGIRQNQDGSVSAELNSGNLGSIRLQLSPRIQEQLARADRTIDVTPNAPAGGQLPLEMLNLNDTRTLIQEEKSSLDKQFDFSALLDHGFEGSKDESEDD